MNRGNPDGPFLATALGKRAARRPMWIMRQAGRYLPEYRAMRERYSFLELCNTPEAAAEVTLQPIDRFDLDAAILFTDLLVPIAPMGVGLRYEPGPVLSRTVQSAADVEALGALDPDTDLAPMLETVRLVRQRLDPGKALIGFVGAPFTLACYMIEGKGSKTWDRTRRLLHEQPEVFDALLDRLASALEPLVAALVANGCDAVQTFDSWAAVLAPGDWAERCAPRTERLLRAARDAGGVAIHYVNGAAQHMPRMVESCAHVLAFDWRLDMSAARALAPDTTLQGNLDPTMLFAAPDRLRQAVRAVCTGAGAERHIFNLGHGILPEVDPAAVEVLCDEVRRS
ncbi:MAG: uroporphyrinogen decarboxylase [Planctomycetes bacterium]|nr:uroporphyrinogen decarboxylase [Planctomycetota bacterium]MCB9869076.1 uroporphyrinogen decarboxylase [Planctomycetota bacterium]MCB9888034.1 uroporphyrinogen decarboxylase [Planctomycetota bacterium]